MCKSDDSLKDNCDRVCNHIIKNKKRNKDKHSDCRISH